MQMSFNLLPLICLFAFSFAENGFEIEFPDKLAFDEFAKNDIFSPEILGEFAEHLEKFYTSSGRVHQANAKSTVAVINDYVDKLLTNLNNFTTSRGLNELDIPGVSEKLEYRSPLSLITFTGLLNLTDGKLSGISNIVRTGDVKITYADKHLSILAPLGIRSLSIKYNYIAKIMKLGPRGEIIGDAEGIKFLFRLSYNITVHRFSLDFFEINKIGSIKLYFSKNVLTDWLASLVTNIVLPLFKRIIQTLLNNNVYAILENIVDIINSALANVFP
ncbi:uncharacterized protein LOC108739762 [Agrilus planipennis]|uniref:Uncharacterized protein LOC108739762 n=1 Tax=Agrilus planipennis TaxID=224129 RepID=A0A7F5R6M3_AGRPL|nr:uncharacterized protein LOC108739762 [Agrilus planipennis]